MSEYSDYIGREFRRARRVFVLRVVALGVVTGLAYWLIETGRTVCWLTLSSLVCWLWWRTRQR